MKIIIPTLKVTVLDPAYRTGRLQGYCLKHVSSLLFVILLLSQPLAAQGLTIGSGAVFTLGGSTLTLPGNWNDNGTFNAGTGTVLFNGSGLQTITSAAEDVFYNLTVNKSSNNVQLANNITLNGTLTLTSGRFDINTHLLTLGSSASLIETAGNILTGGTTTTTRLLNTPNSVNIMGAEITSSADLGSTVIIRGYGVHTAYGHNSIFRYYDITPSNNTGLNATLVFHYDDSEINSLTESDLSLFRSTDSGTSWGLAGGVVNTTANTVTLTGVSDFSLWTLGSSSSPLPVELSTFTASSERLTAVLKWKTETETDNYGFEIERLKDYKIERLQDLNQKWEKAGFVKGNGNSNSRKAYEFVDNNLSSGNYTYRLKQIDNSGSFKYSEETKIEIGSAPAEFNLAQNYPNPFNPETMIEFTLNQNGNASLKVYNALGEEVATLFNELADAGKYYQVRFSASTLTSGVYFARLQQGDKYLIRKMLYLK